MLYNISQLIQNTVQNAVQYLNPFPGPFISSRPSSESDASSTYTESSVESRTHHRDSAEHAENDTMSVKSSIDFTDRSSQRFNITLARQNDAMPESVTPNKRHSSYSPSSEKIFQQRYSLDGTKLEPTEHPGSLALLTARMAPVRDVDQWLTTSGISGSLNPLLPTKPSFDTASIAFAKPVSHSSSIQLTQDDIAHLENPEQPRISTENHVPNMTSVRSNSSVSDHASTIEHELDRSGLNISIDHIAPTTTQTTPSQPLNFSQIVANQKPYNPTWSEDYSFNRAAQRTLNRKKTAERAEKNAAKLKEKIQNYSLKLNEIENSALPGEDMLKALRKTKRNRPAECKDAYQHLLNKINYVIRLENMMKSIAESPMAVTIEGFSPGSQNRANAIDAMYREKRQNCIDVKNAINSATSEFNVEPFLPQNTRDRLINQIDYHLNVINHDHRFLWIKEKNYGAVKYRMPTHDQTAFKIYNDLKATDEGPYNDILFKGLHPKEARKLAALHGDGLKELLWQKCTKQGRKFVSEQRESLREKAATAFLGEIDKANQLSFIDEMMSASEKLSNKIGTLKSKTAECFEAHKKLEKKIGNFLENQKLLFNLDTTNLTDKHFQYVNEYSAELSRNRDDFPSGLLPTIDALLLEKKSELIRNFPVFMEHHFNLIRNSLGSLQGQFIKQASDAYANFNILGQDPSLINEYNHAHDALPSEILGLITPLPESDDANSALEEVYSSPTPTQSLPSHASENSVNQDLHDDYSFVRSSVDLSASLIPSADQTGVENTRLEASTQVLQSDEEDNKSNSDNGSISVKLEDSLQRNSVLESIGSNIYTADRPNSTGIEPTNLISSLLQPMSDNTEERENILSSTELTPQPLNETELAERTQLIDYINHVNSVSGEPSNFTAKLQRFEALDARFQISGQSNTSTPVFEDKLNSSILNIASNLTDNVSSQPVSLSEAAGNSSVEVIENPTHNYSDILTTLERIERDKEAGLPLDDTIKVGEHGNIAIGGINSLDRHQALQGSLISRTADSTTSAVGSNSSRQSLGSTHQEQEKASSMVDEKKSTLPHESKPNRSFWKRFPLFNATPKSKTEKKAPRATTEDIFDPQIVARVTSSKNKPLQVGSPLENTGLSKRALNPSIVSAPTQPSNQAAVVEARHAQVLPDTKAQQSHGRTLPFTKKSTRLKMEDLDDPRIKAKFTSEQNRSRQIPRTSAQNSPLPSPTNLTELFALTGKNISRGLDKHQENAQIAAAQNALSALLATQLALPGNPLMNALAEKLEADATREELDKIAETTRNTFFAEKKNNFVSKKLKDHYFGTPYENLKPKLTTQYEKEYDEKIKPTISDEELRSHINAATKAHFKEKAKDALDDFSAGQTKLINRINNDYLNPISQDARIRSLERSVNHRKQQDFESYSERMNQILNLSAEEVNYDLVNHIASFHYGDLLTNGNFILHNPTEERERSEMLQQL